MARERRSGERAAVGATVTVVALTAMVTAAQV
ncbi:hypothetical protein Y717_16270 [Streptomyces scopuliridis RB72]|uniref:Uncharacterized protein n=1 Tax=Streptomyces scopuliridis RB72 TaxID=1440053 RepID=A0A2T7TEP4_9ACTN|nr:hypothetical protein Y717_16270 [Streptomyces scopuliridis RB72]